MNELVMTESRGGNLALYSKMQNAIAECHLVDDCKAIADQAVAIAAYHKQIKDDTSFRKFIEIKLRAYRRIGEILSVVVDDCDGNMSAYIRKIRVEVGSLLGEVNDNVIRQAIRVIALPQEFFDANVLSHTSIDSLVNGYAREQREEYLATPEGRKEQRERDKEVQEDIKMSHQHNQAREKREQREIHQISVLKQAQNHALDEVGITLDQEDDRVEMHQIVLLIKKSVSEVLRTAAFDNRTTQQAILRSGLFMWLVAHGYDVTLEDMKAPNKE